MAEYPQIGIYEHYKSTPESRKYYQLLAIAQHTEANEKLAIYIPLYTDLSHKGLKIQARPLGMFTEEVEVDGKTVPRFRYLGSEI